MAPRSTKLASVVAASLLSACATTSMTTTPTYPAAPRDEVVEVIHGVPVADPYR